MCGLIGIAAREGETPSLNDRQLTRLRDLLSHRGPDSAGFWRSRNVALAHRRLIVIDPSPLPSMIRSSRHSHSPAIRSA